MKIAILGFGKEGRALFKFLKGENPDADISILDKKRDAGYLGHLDEFDVVYRSPGVPFNLPEIRSARKKGVVILSGTKLFFERAPGMIIGVTGTKGKGTTSTLLYSILKNDGRDVFLAGNIGKPAISILPNLTKNSIAVLELSSFQLQDMDVSPHIAVVLDVFPDHMDVHKNFREYADAKANIAAHQEKGDFVFCPSDSERGKRIAQKSKGKQVFVPRDSMPLELRIPGEHNRTNASMAAAVATHLGVSPITALKTIASYKGLPHRLEHVKTVRGVEFYDDSASTNPDTAIAAIRSFPEKGKIIIMGGVGKNLNYSRAAKVAREHKIKLAVLIGENRGDLKRLMEKQGVPVAVSQTLQRAVSVAFRQAASGDVVILSPGAASFDMFRDYRDRGATFKKIVKTL